MSTIKSSAEDLTLNADGSGNDIKFQSNAVEKASISDAGLLTTAAINVTGTVDNTISGTLVVKGGLSANQTSALTLFQQSSTHSTIKAFGADGSTTGILNTYVAASDGSPDTLVTSVTADGLTFNGDTAAANALSDYEEGTWTPDLTNGTSESTNTATYIKIGRKVFYYVYIDNLSYPSDGEHFLIDGLPFSARGSFYQGGTIGYVGDSDLASQGLMVLTLGTYIYFHRQDGTTNRALNNTMDSCANLIVSGSYEAA